MSSAPASKGSNSMRRLVAELVFRLRTSLETSASQSSSALFGSRTHHPHHHRPILTPPYVQVESKPHSPPSSFEIHRSDVVIGGDHHHQHQHQTDDDLTSTSGVPTSSSPHSSTKEKTVHDHHYQHLPGDAVIHHPHMFPFPRITSITTTMASLVDTRKTDKDKEADVPAHNAPAMLSTERNLEGGIQGVVIQMRKELGLDALDFDQGVFQTLPNDGVTNSKYGNSGGSTSNGGGGFTRAGFDRVVLSQVMPDLWLFGVIDGHGLSSLCAEYLHEAFPVVIQLLIHNTERKREGDETSSEAEEDGFYSGILREAFRVCAQEWDKSAPKTSLIDHDHRHSGAVALMVLIKNNKCYVANAGDCRAVVSDGNGAFRDVHELHRTDNPDERARVIEKGGKIKHVHGILRVQGSLMPTRAFGDISVRTDFLGNLHDFVNPDPDVCVVEPEKDRLGKAYLLVATDGLWDAVPDGEISRAVSEGIRVGKTADVIAKELGEMAAMNTQDDVSVLLLVW